MSEQPTPKTKWYVTEYPEECDFAITDGNEILVTIIGGNTIGDQCDLASRIAKLPDLERELAEAIDKYQSLQKTFEEWQLKFLSEQAELLHNKDVERDKLFDEAYQIRIERDELKSALRRILNADIPRPLGGIIDDDERKAAIEWNAFERGEARQHAKAILQQNCREGSKHFNKMNCPDCHGKGYFIGVAHFDMKDGKSYNKFGKLPCRLCEATGEVPDETQKWIDIGKRMRSDRLKRKESQRSAASKMGVTLKEYSEMEQGRINNEHI